MSTRTPTLTRTRASPPDTRGRAAQPLIFNASGRHLVGFTMHISTSAHQATEDSELWSIHCLRGGDATAVRVPVLANLPQQERLHMLFSGSLCLSRSKKTDVMRACYILPSGLLFSIVKNAKRRRSRRSVFRSHGMEIA